MPILATAEKLILDEINVENGLALTAQDVVFGGVQIPTEDEDVTKANGHNAMVRVEALPGAKALGYTTVYYDRLNFNEMFTAQDSFQPMVIPVRLDSVHTAHDIVPLINQYYGLSLRTTDVVDTPIDRNTWIVKITAADDSLGWIGEIDVQLIPGDALIPSNFDTASISPYTLPYFNTKAGQGAVYGYPWRFDDYAAQLATYSTTVDESGLRRLGQIMTNVTGDPWTFYRNPLDYNLKETKVIYNGRNKSEFPTNPSYDNVLVIELSLYCLNFGGRMYLHYNDPD